MENAEKLFENLLSESLEFVLYSDGDTVIRQQGSFGEDENQVSKIISLSPGYWSDMLTEWSSDLPEETTDKNRLAWIGENCKDDFISEVLENMLEA